jgi:hypothetical protein
MSRHALTGFSNGVPARGSFTRFDGVLSRGSVTEFTGVVHGPAGDLAVRGEPTNFWAKLRRDADTKRVIEWHPLADHCADVAAVTETLLHLPIWRRRLARLAGQALSDSACARLSVLAALHDIGKLNIGFQAKGRPELGATAGHVKEALGALFRRPGVFSCLDELAPWGEATTDLLVSAICRVDTLRRDAFLRVAPEGYLPRAAQTALVTLPRDERGSITILESETGSGKTEAVLARFVSLFEAGIVDGLYFALPTRSAATQMHRRVREAAQRAFATPPAVVLAVPGYLRVDDAEGTRLPPFEVLWPDQERFRYRAWAAENPKPWIPRARGDAPLIGAPLGK